MTILLRDWKVEPLLQTGETVDCWKKRVFEAEPRFSLAVDTVNVEFTRRERQS